MKTFKQFLKENMDNKDKSYFLGRSKKFGEQIDSLYKFAEDFCRELYDEGELDDEASILMDDFESLTHQMNSKLKRITDMIKKS